MKVTTAPARTVCTATRDVADRCPRPRRTVGGLVVAALAPLAALAALSAPAMVAVAALSAAVTLLARELSGRGGTTGGRSAASTACC